MTAQVSRLPFSLDLLMAEAKRRMRKRRLLILTVAVLAGGGAAGAAVALNSSNPVAAVASVNCGRGVPGPGFRVFACGSGGVLAGHPHPKELLVVRTDGASVAFPSYRVAEFSLDGEVVATYNVNLVRVTSTRLIPLLTTGELARALHTRPNAIVDIYSPRLDEHGDIYFVASILTGLPGCRNRVLERTTGGTIRQIRDLRSNLCR